uniref:Immunoglobulin V-set domain-containing protein n=1 Tax=Nothobranchius kuhntae TaxID=321403 RepID=A0A1A8I4F6_NOTKU
MKSFVVTFCCFSAVCVEASDILEMSGHVGGDVSIPCSSCWNTENRSENTSLYFCKGLCSGENPLIQTEVRSAVTRRGRYGMESDEAGGVFTVTIRRLRRADAGRYRCGIRFDLSHQEVILNVVDASTVPTRPPPSPQTNTKMDEVTRAQSTEASSGTSTLFSSERKSQQKANDLTDTAVVIMVSGCLAVLVCAIIPLIFYRHWRNHAGQDRPSVVRAEEDSCDENVASTQVVMSLQSLEPEDHPESSIDDNLQYAVIYEGLDPKTVH